MPADPRMTIRLPFPDGRRIFIRIFRNKVWAEDVKFLVEYPYNCCIFLSEKIK